MTLVQFWTQERDLYRGRRTALTTALNTLQKDLDKARSDPATGLTAAQTALAATEAAITAKRAALATATIPAEAQALVTAIRDLQIDQRLTTGELFKRQDTVDALQRDVDLHAQLLQRVTAAQAEAEAKLKTAEDAARRRDTLKTRATTAPLKDIPAQANTAKTGPDHNAAKARVDQLPSELLDLATKRLNHENTRLADAATALRAAEDEQIAQRKASGGEGKAAQERADFERAEEALQSFVSTSQSAFDSAIAVFKAIAAAPVLTASEATAIAADAARTAAAGLADAVADARVTVEAAAVDLDATIFTKRAADADANLSADAAVNGKKSTLAAAETALADALKPANYPDADKKTMNEWQAIATDRSWKQAVDFFDAKASITRLAAIATAALTAALDTKEAAYVAVLNDLAKIRRRQEFVDDATAVRRQRLASIEKERPLRVVSAVRGDSF